MPKRAPSQWMWNFSRGMLLSSMIWMTLYRSSTAPRTCVVMWVARQGVRVTAPRSKTVGH